MTSRLLLFGATILCLITESAIAAKCDFQQDTNDFFSGVPTIRTAWTGRTPILSAVSESGNQWLEVKISFSNSSRFVPTQDVLDSAFDVPLGAKLEITLDDGTLVELSAMDPVKGSTNIVYPYENKNKDYITFVHAKIRYELSAGAASMLGAQKAAAVRVHATDQHHDMNLPKGSERFKDAVNCLQEGVSR